MSYSFREMLVDDTNEKRREEHFKGDIRDFNMVLHEFLNCSSREGLDIHYEFLCEKLKDMYEYRSRCIDFKNLKVKK